MTLRIAGGINDHCVATLRVPLTGILKVSLSFSIWPCRTLNHDMDIPWLRFRFAVAFLAFLKAVYVCSVRFDAVRVVTTNIALLWDVTPRSLLEVCGSTEMPANFCHTAWPHVPECSNSLIYAYNVVCLTSYRYCRQVSIVSISIDSVHLSAEQLTQ